MQVVYKYPLTVNLEPTEVTLPRGARILSCSEQKGRLFLWCQVNPEEEETDKRTIVVKGTGWVWEEEEWKYLEHIDSVVMEGGLVFHIFEGLQNPLYVRN